MKLPSPFRTQFIVRALLILACSMAGLGCSPVPKYRAPNLPEAKMAKLKSGGFITIARIDGADPQDHFPFSGPYFVAPGRRELIVKYGESYGQYSVSYEVLIPFEFKAGHEYFLDRYKIRMIDKTDNIAYVYRDDKGGIRPTPLVVKRNKRDSDDDDKGSVGP